jgi:hypothetical protein
MKRKTLVKNKQKWKGAKGMTFRLNRINPNQTQVFYYDGRYETLTNEEVDELIEQLGGKEEEEQPF